MPPPRALQNILSLKNTFDFYVGTIETSRMIMIREHKYGKKGERERKKEASDEALKLHYLY